MGEPTAVSPEAAAAGRIVEALWPARGAAGRVLLGPGVDADPRYEGPGEPVKDRDIAKAIRDRVVGVVVLRRLSPTLLRALRSEPIDLLVLTGDDDELSAAELGALARHVLGPRAVLRVGELSGRAPGRTIACAHAADELEGIRRALGPRPLPLCLAPTPPWLCGLLEHPSLARIPIVGTLGHSALHGGWVHWARTRSTPQVVVPVGIEAPQLDADEPDEVLMAIVAAHALERVTGPVFPAPRVIAGVLEGLEDGGQTNAPTPEQLAIWTQARRALPLTGAAVGMQAPDRDLPLNAPTAAFLAQRVLLRARAHTEALRGGLPPRPTLDEDGLERATELLRNAAGVLTDQESKVVLRGFGFEVTRQAVASSASGAAGFADRIGYPVVLKVLSPDLRRRTDVGGVVLSLTTASAVRRAYATIVDNVERSAPTARIDGVVVAEMVGSGVDVRCGVRRLDNGERMIYGRIEGASSPVEAALALLPLRPEDALALAHAVLSRAPVPALRRHSDPDVPGLAALFVGLSELFAETDDRIVSVDLGPVRMLEPPRGLVTLDARITQRAHLEGL